eukprot:403356635
MNASIALSLPQVKELQSNRQTNSNVPSNMTKSISEQQNTTPRSHSTSKKLQSLSKRLTNQISFNKAISGGIGDSFSKSINLDIKQQRFHRNTITDGIFSLKQRSQKYAAELPVIEDKYFEQNKIKKSIQSKRKNQMSLPRVEDIKLDQGLSDLKKPYYPDFGYTQCVDFEDSQRATWGSLAKQILSFPKYEKLHKIIEEKSESLKKMEQNERDQKKLQDSMNGMERIRISLRKWIFNKQQTLQKENAVPLDKFHKRLIQFDKKYQTMKKDISMISTQTDTFDNFIQKIKQTPVSKIQLQLPRQDKLSKTYSRYSRYEHSHQSRSVDSNEDNQTSSQNNNEFTPKQIQFRRTEFNNSQNKISLSQTSDFQFRNNVIGVTQRSVERIANFDVQNNQVSKNKLNSKSKVSLKLPAAIQSKELNKLSQNSQGSLQVSQSRIFNQDMSLDQNSKRALNYFNMQSQLIDKKIQRWSLQKQSLDSRIQKGKQDYQKVSKQFNQWLKGQHQSVPRQLGQSVDYLKFIESRNNSQELLQTASLGQVKTSIGGIAKSRRHAKGKKNQDVSQSVNLVKQNTGYNVASLMQNNLNSDFGINHTFDGQIQQTQRFENQDRIEDLMISRKKLKKKNKSKQRRNQNNLSKRANLQLNITYDAYNIKPNS